MGLSAKIAKSITNNDNPKAIATRLRAKRLSYLVAMIEDVYKKYGNVNIIDIGGTKAYWNILPKNVIEGNKIRITIINLPGSFTTKNDKYFTFLEGDGCNLSMVEDNFFHIAHSNSVLEHVGDWAKMKDYARELKRVSDKYYVQTPNYWFPVEPHCMTPFFHWLPIPLRISLVTKFNLGHWKKQDTIDGAVNTVESARLVDKKMFRELFSDAVIKTERLFFLPKSFIGIKN